MSRQIEKFAAAVLVVMGVAGWAPSLVASPPQAQTQPPTPESMLKVDVVLTRHGIDPGKPAPEPEAANLARMEALFQKGLVTKQQIDAARLSAKLHTPVSRLPYSLFVPVGTGGQRTSLRVGVDLPGEPSTTTSKEGVTTTRRDTRFVGTSIDSSASLSGEGRYRLYLSIQDSSVLPADRKEFAAPVIRNFTTSNSLYVREGQPLTFSVGTDPISGETLRAEVTVTVVK
jgi:hypothetical protein